MHRALYVEDILVCIFSHCWVVTKRRCSSADSEDRLDSEGPRYFANFHLASLARTCKTFKEPALDLIWSQLENLKPLVRFLNQSQVDRGGVYRLNAPLTQTQWDTILGYARRVKGIHSMSGSLGLSEKCIKTLSKGPLGSTASTIFPNLRSLGLIMPRATIIPIIQHFASPNLTEFSLHFPQNMDPRTLVRTFSERCPNVSYFSVSVLSGSPTRMNKTISNLMCRWKHIRFVECPMLHLTDAALSHLSHLPDLRSLQFQVHDLIIHQISSTQSSNPTLFVFSALRKLSLSSASLPTISTLLRHFSVPVIHCLQVHPHLRNLTFVAFISFITDLQRLCAEHSLNDLSLVLDDEYGESDFTFDEDEDEDSPPIWYINLEILSPLTCFTNLKHLTLDISYGVDLNEAELLSFASSWPLLETFELGKKYEWTSLSGITPGGFLRLLETCRSLKKICFRLDARGYTEIPQGHPWRGLTMTASARIHLLHSPVEEESIEALAVFFHVVSHPKFKLVTYWEGDDEDEDEDEDFDFRGRDPPMEFSNLHCGRWQRVRLLAHDLWEKRENLRRSLET